MALDISSGREKDKLFYTIVSHAVELLDADAGGIGLLNEQGQRIFVPFTYNLPDTLNNMSFNLNSDLFGLVINTGNAQRISDYQILAHPIKELADAGLSAVAVVPLRVRGKVIGVLWISMLSSGRPFSDYDVALLESIGGQAAVAI
ncbi:MAG TPA: GAF domain-containing protein, partial [Anaerolineae bacterium]|nr:GAF domain-containing protein [Anaerolineae bacterium]